MVPQGNPQSKWCYWLVGIIVLLLLSLPFLYAYVLAGRDFIFGGFLFNPLDGNTYLAKQYQGWQGEWAFRLTYSPDAPERAHLFLFYLLLGHLGRFLSLPLDYIFHLARLVSALVLLVMLYRFTGEVLSNSSLHLIGFLLLAVGSGMGWVLLPFNFVTSDFWLAEAYPFLSSYANPHFPLSLALFLWLLSTRSLQRTNSYIQTVLSLLGGVFLSVLSPFGVVLALMILASWIVWVWLEGRGQKVETKRGKRELLKNLSLRLTGLAVGGLPTLLYYRWVTESMASFAIWNAQNLTPAPALWDVIISFSPSLLLALVGGIALVKDQQDLPEPKRMLLIWLVCGLGLLYAPMGLQRRFLMGIYIPITCLAMYVLGRYLSSKPHIFKMSVMLLCGLSLPTNLLLLATAMSAAESRVPQLYLSKYEHQALEWIAQNTPKDSVILASPQMSLYIPSRTGRRVVYGHPYETVNAEDNLDLVKKLFMLGSKGLILKEQQKETISEIDYVFWGARERKLAQGVPFDNLEVVYENAQVRVFLWHNNE